MGNLQQINAIEKVEKYIKKNIHNAISLQDIALESGYSGWYISKLFKQYTDKNIFEYIRSLRLSNAAIKLRDDDDKILDVALDYMFESHEGFTRAFSREFGINPKKYSQQTPPIRLFMPYSVMEHYKHQHKEGKRMETKKTNNIFVQVIERPARKLILKRGIKAEDYYEFCEEVGCDDWGILCSVKEALNEPMGCWLPDNMIKPGTSKYVQGVEVPVDYDKKLPVGYDTIVLQPCKMMIFQGPKYDDDFFEEAIGDMWDVIASYDPTLYGFQWDESIAPHFQFEPQGYRGYIEGKPVKLMNE